MIILTHQVNMPLKIPFLGQFYARLKSVKSRRVTESRPVCFSRNA